MSVTSYKPHDDDAKVLKNLVQMGGRSRAPAPADGIPRDPTPTRKPRQLAFPFPAATSRRALRRPLAPRMVAPPVERPIEELQLEGSLGALLPAGRTLTVKVTDNRYTMVMVRRGAGAYTVRLHRMFADADAKLLRALARYVVHNDQRASAAIGAFIEEHQHVIRRQPRRVRRVVLRTAGRAHDLQPIYDRLNRAYFGGTLEARITWGTAPRRQRPRRSIKMGSFAVEDRIIRIHPVLDHPSVPEYFVAWIVFHEMLHGKYEVVRKGDRRCFHSKAFVAEERTFQDYEKACAWERANMDRLLGS
jgi:predicted metal-dependent hydrolase